jgi:hypothetical protein
MTGHTQSSPKYVGETYDDEGYTVVKNNYIPMRDGTELCADIFLPTAAIRQDRQIPVICSLAPYGKDVPVFKFGLPRTPIYVDMYSKIKPLGPHACFELLDPLIWVSQHQYLLRQGFICSKLTLRLDQGLWVCPVESRCTWRWWKPRASGSFRLEEVIGNRGRRRRPG